MISAVGDGSGICPDCGRQSLHRHGWHERHLQDLPAQGAAVTVELRIQRWQCRNQACKRQTFAGQLPEIAAPSARRTVRAAELVDVEFAATIILGPGFRHKNALLELLAKTRRQFTIRENVNDMRAQMVQSDLALCSYGMTAFELAATGVPAIYLCLSEDHAESASALADAGAGRSLGVVSDVGDQQVADAIGGLLADAEKRARMSADAHRLIDGQGARRIAELLADRAWKLWVEA